MVIRLLSVFHGGSNVRALARSVRGPLVCRARRRRNAFSLRSRVGGAAGDISRCVQ